MKLFFIIWHKCLGHLNFQALKRHLTSHNIYYNNDEHVCDSCEGAKAIKRYNCIPQKRRKRPYQLIHTDIVGLIILIRFGVKRYFFTFTDDHMCITKTYITRWKSKWLKSLKAFYNLICIRIRLEQSIKRLWSNYGSELQSRKVNKCLTN